MPLALSLSTCIQTTAICTALLWLKFVVSNVSLGGAKLQAGARAPEDVYQKKPPTTGTELRQQDFGDKPPPQPPLELQNLDRAQRIVNNDLENIPLTLIMSWASVLVIALCSPSKVQDGLAKAHTIFIVIFTAMRILHTIAYSMKKSSARSLFWIIALLCSFGTSFNCIAAAFSI
eukprot:gb/GEZN01016522.1/.p1 GENE.gb/GEZN01016522.1/~~gb/GEZN01016522.1/.p1  ORF type:complete len:175 (-),score=20.43 gb/GEZN01016522.1/:262-786(-)